MAVISRSGEGEGQGRFDHGSDGLPSSEAKQRTHNHHATARTMYGACLVTMQRNHARRAEMTFIPRRLFLLACVCGEQVISLDPFRRPLDRQNDHGLQLLCASRDRPPLP